MKFIAAFLLLGAASSAGLSVADLQALRAVDLRLATIAHRLAIGNAALCRDTAPATGAVIHALTQYDAATQGAAKAAFGFATPIAVEAVVPDSAADRAGVRADDGMTAIGDRRLVASATPPSSADRDGALDTLANAESPIRLTLMRGGAERSVSLTAPRGCRAAFEVLLGPAMTAQSDGRVVQIGVRFFERYRDEETAVIVAHELAHIILRHRARLSAAGVKSGLLSELGRNGRLHRRTEAEADRLGVTLLHNAGYNPASAARFWAAHGGDIDGGLFRSRTHPATKARIAALEQEAAMIPGDSRPHIPAVLAARDEPLD